LLKLNGFGTMLCENEQWRERGRLGDWATRRGGEGARGRGNNGTI